MVQSLLSRGSAVNDRDQHDAWSAGRSHDVYTGRCGSRVAVLPRLARSSRPRSRHRGAVVRRVGAALTALARRHRPVRRLRPVRPRRHRRRPCPIRRRVPRSRSRSPTITPTSSPRRSPTIPSPTGPPRPASSGVSPAGRDGLVLQVGVPGRRRRVHRGFWKAEASIDDGAGALDEADGSAPRSRSGPRSSTPAVSTSTRTRSRTPSGWRPRFADFAAFRHPFTLGAGPAPGYLASLDPDACPSARARASPRARRRGGQLIARAWVMRSRSPA
jgi:hypothetical protein